MRARQGPRNGGRALKESFPEQLRLFQRALLGLREKPAHFITDGMMDHGPSRVNLRTWGLSIGGDIMCPLCKQYPQTTRHVLVSCPKALEQHRYTMRHNRVLLTLAYAVRTVNPTAEVWFDLPGFGAMHPMLQNYAQELRPDGFVILDDVAYILELTAPSEERMNIWNERKQAKYELIRLTLATARTKTCKIVAFEVGARGMPNNSCEKLKPLLGTQYGPTIINMSRSAIMGSYAIWSARQTEEWVAHSAPVMPIDEGREQA